MTAAPRTVTVCVVLTIPFFATGALADDFKTIDGKDYKNATVSRVEPDGIVLTSKLGISKVYFTELPQEMRQRFHYDATQAAQFIAATQIGISQHNSEIVAQQQAMVTQQRRQAEIQRQATEEQRQVVERQAKIEAQQQRGLETQQKQDAKIAAQNHARQQQQRKQRTTTGHFDRHWKSWKHTFPGGYEEMSGNARMGHRHSESHDPYSPNAPRTDNVTDESWGPAR